MSDSILPPLKPLEDKEAVSNLRYIISNMYYIPAEYKKYLTTYYTRHWSADQFFRMVKDGTVTYQGVTYSVLYYNTDPTKLMRRIPYSFVKCSFRIADKRFDLLPTVLVQENKGSD